MTHLGFALTLSLALSIPANATEISSAQIKKNKTGLFQDIFNDHFYDLTSYLRLDRLYRLVTQTKSRSANVNVFEEVPDSNFFTNRHGKKRLSIDELKKGPRETTGPAEGALTVTNGKFQGLHPGFFITDTKGEKYLLKFDDIDLFELETSAEVIASLFYHAIGYNVPQYTIATITPDQLTPGPTAKTLDDTGFKKALTADRLEEYLLFLPQDANGNYRASASKILAGENKGHFEFGGRRKHDPEDLIDHKLLREIRALRVFGSWLNNYDTRESNTLDMLQEEDGKKVLKHYVIDFNSALGRGILFPMFTFEHMMDFGEATKAYLGLGFWEKTWQKRWREKGQEVTNSPAVWDFDNEYFNPEKFKLQLPHFSTKDLTNADAYWAAKIIMAFTDEEIRAIVAEGKLSEQEDADYVSKVLIERRDIIGKFWFDRVTPVDRIDLKGSLLTFEDLGVKYDFYTAGQTRYRANVDGDTKEFTESQLDLSSWLNQGASFKVKLSVSREGGAWSPPVEVKLSRDGIQSIKQQD